MVTELLQKYIWLVQTFIRAGEHGLDLNEICNKWEDRFDTPYSRRTFNNHRDAVLSVFGIMIECNRSTNRYFIKYTEDVADENAENAWLINTFTVNNLLRLSKDRLSGRIAVEDIPSGHMFLTGVMEAMDEGHEIIITYQKYTKNESEAFTLQPYAVKEFAKRWYVIAYCKERKGLRVYGLDRVKSLEMTANKFRMPENFDVDELFSTSFGIYIPEGKPMFIKYRAADEKESKYLRDLPIHRSQEELGHDGTGNVFRIFVCPNENLIMEFCKYGNKIEILEPQDMRAKIGETLKAAAEQYKTK